MTVGSLAYRKNETSILRGSVPVKYERLLPYIPGERILEIGSAEGVLALCLARSDLGAKKQVTAIERQLYRHETALLLAKKWGREYRFTTTVGFVNGDIIDHLDLMKGVDTLVAVRAIYYLHDNLDRVFNEAAKAKVANVVLCGNANRMARYRRGLGETGGADDYYASPEGMADVLGRNGYRVVRDTEGEGIEGDPIIVGHLD